MSKVLEIKFNQLVKKIENKTGPAKHYNATECQLCCPAHDDNTPSLGITLKDGKILIKCQAGCETESVLKSVGLEWNAIFDSDGTHSPKATIERLAEHFEHEASFLHSLGLADSYNGVIVPYFDKSKAEVMRKIRHRMYGDKKFSYPKGTKTQLYGQWMPTSDTLFIVEGESDCWALWRGGFVARGIPGSSHAKVLKREHLKHVKHIVVLQEADRAGEKFTANVAAQLYSVKFNGTLAVARMADHGFKDVAEVLIVQCGDVDRFKDSLKTILETAEARNIGDVAYQELDEDERTPAFKKLMRHALKKVDLFTDDITGITYASYNGQDVPVVSSEFTSFLTKEYNEHIEYGILSSQVKEAVFNIDSFSRNQVKTYRRIANLGDRIVYDLGDGNVVNVTRDGWEVGKSDIKFLRNSDYGIQDKPESGGTLEMFRKMFDNLTDENFAVLIGFILDAMKGHMPFLHLQLNGQHGSGKTTLSNCIAQLIDPCKTPAGLAPPKTHDDLVLTSVQRYLLSIENVSYIPASMSDDYCRLSTGLKSAKRKLYTSSDVVQFQTANPVIYNGIPDFISRDVLRSRIVRIELMPPKGEYRIGVEKEFDALRPYILGALFDLMAVGLKHKDEKRTLKTRMADSLNWITACETGSDLQLSSAHLSNVDANMLDALENDMFVYVIVKFLRRRGGKYSGSMTELHSLLTPVYCGDMSDAERKAIPSGSNALSARFAEKIKALERPV